MTSRPLPRVTLMNNLRLLMAAHGLSAPEVARRSKVDPKTVNNMVNGRYDPRPEKVRAVAEVFGLTEWQLLIPDLPVELARRGELDDLLSHYIRASANGRENIVRIAEMEARYAESGPRPVPGKKTKK